LDGEKYSTASSGAEASPEAAIVRMEEDRDLDPLIDPGLLFRAATRRAEVRTAARVDARLLAAPRDADAKSVAVGIANVCVAVGWVRRARWGGDTDCSRVIQSADGRS
jgi:hypothetical protein